MASAKPWLAIVGIGEDGAGGLGAAARACVEGAEVVFGGGRQLALAGRLVRGEAREWPRPFAGALEAVLQERGRAVCVLASGDPLLHGVGSVLVQRVPVGELRVIPGVSAFSLAAARLGWDLAQTVRVSLHGRPLAELRRQLQAGGRVLALTSDERSPAALAQLLVQAGFGDSRLVVLEALGGPRERVRESRAAAFALEDVDPLHVVAIEVCAGAQARVLPLAPGLPDEWFEHDGQLTKREARALALAALAPRRGELLWDVGAGAGSVAIEWLLADGSLRAIAVEARAERAARIARNAAALGVPGLQLCEGRAPGVLAGLAAPDAVFVGGGTGEPALLDAVRAALRPGARLVAHAVTLAGEAQLLAQHAALGGELLRIELARAAPLGGYSGWQPARPLTQWRWVQP